MNTEPITRTHEYTPISYDRCVPRPEIADIQRALMMLPDEPVLSIGDAIRIEIDDEWILEDEIVVYRRRIYQMQNQNRRRVLLKVDTRHHHRPPRSSTVIIAECPMLLE